MLQGLWVLAVYCIKERFLCQEIWPSLMSLTNKHDQCCSQKKKKKMMKMRLLGLAGIFPAKDKMNPPRTWIREIRLFFGVSTQLLLFLETFLLLTFLFTDITLFTLPSHMWVFGVYWWAFKMMFIYSGFVSRDLKYGDFIMPLLMTSDLLTRLINTLYILRHKRLYCQWFSFRGDIGVIH